MSGMTLTVDDAEFGVPVDNGVFELAAMDLPKGKSPFTVGLRDEKTGD
jgi:hypothetical protein